MAVSVPASDKKNIEKAAEVTALAAAVTLQGTATPSAQALAQRQLQVNMEHVIGLMTSGKLSPLTILSTCTYGT